MPSGVPGCPDGRYWDGYRCSEISEGSGAGDCPSGSHWEYGRCEPDVPGAPKPPEKETTASPKASPAPPVGAPPPVPRPTGGPGPAEIAIAPYSAARPDAYSNQLYDLLLKSIQDAYAGKFVPYNEETLNLQKGKLFQASTGRAAAAKQALGQDLIRRNMSRAGVAGELTSAIDRSAATDYTSGYRDILIQAAEKNYQAKVTALQEARNIVQIRAQYDLSNARNELDRNIASSNAALGYLRIQQEAANLQAQLEAAYRLAELGNQAALEQLLISQGIKPPNLPV